MDEKTKKERRITKKVKEFLKSVKTFIIAKNGTIPAEWACSLSMLEEYYYQFCQLTEEIKSLDSLVIDTRYGVAPSPLLKARDATSVRLESLLKSFGLTLKSASSMAMIEPVKQESNLEAFVREKQEKKERRK